MTRSLYRCLLWLHRRAFREQFAREMLWIFDEAAESQGVSALLVDGILSLARQRLMRSGSWKVAAAIAGGLLQITFGGLGHLVFANAKLALQRAGWVGEMQMEAPDGGTRSLPARDVRLERGSFRLRLETSDAVIRFQGKFVQGAQGKRLAGTFEVTAGGRNDALGPAGKRLGEGTWELIRRGH